MLFEDVPPGYKYCSDCMAFTPHNEIQLYGDVRHQCVVCDHTFGGYDPYCENCGYIFNEDDINGPDSYFEIIHGPGCHFGQAAIVDINNIQCLHDANESHADYILREFTHGLSFEDYHKLQTQLDYQFEYTCNCQRIKLFYANNRKSISTWHGHGMDCYNHIEWETVMICPICHEEAIFQDGNC